MHQHGLFLQSLAVQAIAEESSRQCGVSQETANEESCYVAINTKSFAKALILNKFATVSKNQTVIVHAKVGIA
jgi:hypothetical protein